MTASAAGGISTAGDSISTTGDADEAYEAWFVQWVASLLHLLPMLLPPVDTAVTGGTGSDDRYTSMWLLIMLER